MAEPLTPSTLWHFLVSALNILRLADSDSPGLLRFGPVKTPIYGRKKVSAQKRGRGEKNAAIVENISKVEEHRQRHRQKCSGADLREPRKALFDAHSESSIATRSVRNILEMVSNLTQISNIYFRASIEADTDVRNLMQCMPKIGDKQMAVSQGSQSRHYMSFVF